MGILDPITEKYYKVVTLNMQREDGEVVAMYQRDLAQFEAATGLEKWVPPEEL